MEEDTEKMIKEIIENIVNLNTDYDKLSEELRECELAVQKVKTALNKLDTQTHKERQKAKKILKLAKETRTVVDIDGSQYIVELFSNSLSVFKVTSCKGIEAKAALNKLGGKK